MKDTDIPQKRYADTRISPKAIWGSMDRLESSGNNRGARTARECRCQGGGRGCHEYTGETVGRTILSYSPPRAAFGWANAMPVWLETSGARGQETVTKPNLNVVEPRYVLPHELRRRSCFDYASGLDEGTCNDPSVVRHAEATVAHFLGSVSFRADEFGKLGPSTPALKLSPGQRYAASATLRRNMFARSESESQNILQFVVATAISIPSFIRPVQKRRRRAVAPAAFVRSAASAGPARHHAWLAVDRRACNPDGTTNARGV